MIKGNDQRYSLFFTGRALELDDDRLEEAASLLSSVAPFSISQARIRLGRSPFQIVGGLRHSQAVLTAKQFKDAGMAVEVRPSEHRIDVEIPREALPFRRIRGKYLAEGSGAAIFTELSTGLLLLVVLAASGLLQILLAHTFLSRDQPLWSLSATGWATLALCFVGLLILLLSKTRQMADILRSPNYNSPIEVFQSYLEAINRKHWLKAASCLAGGLDTVDLGNKGFASIRHYLRRLHSTYVLDTEIDPSRIVMLYQDDSTVVVRVNIRMISRKPRSEGSRIRYELVHVFRCQELGGDWFILDAPIMNQADPERLPVSCCGHCGKEALFGQVSCSSCEQPLLPFAMEAEQWLTQRKKPDLAALLSALVPGLGQVYNGQMFKGIFIGATSWLILPWLVGVVDASIIADRINRRRSLHDMPSHVGFSMGVYVVAIATFIVGVVMNASSMPVISQILEARQEKVESETPYSLVSRFQGDDGSYSILFPFSWEIQTPKNQITNDDGETLALRAFSEEGNTTLIISTKEGSPNWQPCPAAMEARRLLEEQMMEIANVECGTTEGLKQYRLDSYSPDRRYRQSLTVIAFRKELVIIAFVCPTDQQSDMVKVYNQVVTSIRQVDSSGTTIKH